VSPYREYRRGPFGGVAEIRVERRTVTGTVTRAGREDRDRYLNHLSFLYATGHVTDKEELEGMRDAVLAVRTLAGLEAVLEGFPPPPLPPPPRDMAIPENFLPKFLLRSYIGVFTAVLPTVALSHEHGAAANVFTAFFLVLGMSITLNAVVHMWMTSVIWENMGPEERRKRRRNDRR